MTAAEILEAGFRTGFAEGARHGYWLGTLLVIGVSGTSTTLWGWLIRRHYMRQLDDLREYIEDAIDNSNERKE